MFSPSQPMQALAIVRVTAGVEMKKATICCSPVGTHRETGEEHEIVALRLSVPTPTRAYYRFTKSKASGSAIPCPAAGLAHDHSTVSEVGVRCTGSIGHA